MLIYILYQRKLEHRVSELVRGLLLGVYPDQVTNEPLLEGITAIGWRTRPW